MQQRISHLQAIWLAIAGFTCWVLCDSVIKLIGPSGLPNYEVICWMGFSIATFVSAYALWRGEGRSLWPHRPKRLIARSCLDVGNNLCVVVALRHLSLTLFYVLIFTSPMVVAVLGRVFLKEGLGWRRAGAILTGFLGVVLAVFPSRSSGRSVWVGFAACAVCVCCFSVGIVWARVISQAERAESMTLFSGLVSGVVGLVCMLVYAVPLNWKLCVALSVMGLLGAIGNICVFAALRHTAAATVSQYHYSQLVSGSVVAYLLFGERPNAFLLMGALLIVGAGLYIAVHRPQTEEVRAGEVAPG